MGRVTPRYLLYPSEVRTGERGYPKVPTPPPPPEPRYLPPQPGQDGGYPKVPPTQVRMGKRVPQGTYPHPAKDLLHGGGYASCVRGGGLSCYNKICRCHCCCVSTLSSFTLSRQRQLLQIFFCDVATCYYDINISVAIAIKIEHRTNFMTTSK